MSWTKQRSRAYFLEERKKITSAQAEKESERIATGLLEVLAKSPVRYLHSFIADGSRKEVDTRFIRQILQKNLPWLHWAVPRITPGTPKMQHFVWDDATSFIPNRWGIAEPDPISSQLLDTKLIDAVLVPLLAYDRQGNRAGYGGGYYDRFLAQCRADTFKIGLSFFDPIDAISDVNEWDVPLDFCVTPTAVYRWKPIF